MFPPVTRITLPSSDGMSLSGLKGLLPLVEKNMSTGSLAAIEESARRRQLRGDGVGELLPGTGAGPERETY